MNDTIVSKRIMHETQQLLIKYNNVKLIHNQTNIEILVEYNNYNYTIIINSCYPFQKPTMLINNVNYQNWIMTVAIDLEKLYKPSTMGCPCCKSILCNWSPQYTSKDLIKEFIIFREGVINMFNLRIIKKKLECMYPNYCFNIIIMNIWLFIVLD